MNGVHRTSAETAAVHVTPAMPALKYTTSVDIKKRKEEKRKEKKSAIKS